MKKEWLSISAYLLAAIMIFLGGGFLFYLFHKKVIPINYTIIGLIFLIIMGIVIYLFQQTKGIIGKVLGLLFSLIFIIAIIFGIWAFKTTERALTEISGSEQKIDRMLVVVRTDNPATTISQLAGYRIGRQEKAHIAATEVVMKTIQEKNNPEPEWMIYQNIQEEANALLSGEIDAAIYADGFTPILQESIENWDEKVRILSSEDVQVEAPIQTEHSITEPFCVYLSGIDTEGTVDNAGRSDVNIIAAVNPNTHSILLVSTPRDYYVPIPEISGEVRDKLTHAGIYGPEASIRTLENLYDTSIEYYAKLNFTSLVAIVNSLNGIDVNVTQDCSFGVFEFKAGIQHMNGEEALAYCRERKSFIDGDLQRGKNQEAVLTAIIQKCLSPEILFHTNDLISQLEHTIQTSMPKENMLQLIQMQIQDRSGWEIKSMAATGTPDMQPCYSYGITPLSIVWPDDANIQELSQAIKEHQKQ